MSSIDAKRKKGVLYSCIMAGIGIFLAVLFSESDIVLNALKSKTDVYEDGFDYVEFGTGGHIESEIGYGNILSYLGSVEVTHRRRNSISTYKTTTYFYVVAVYDDNGDCYLTCVEVPEKDKLTFDFAVEFDEATTATAPFEGTIKEMSDKVKEAMYEFVDENDATLRRVLNTYNNVNKPGKNGDIKDFVVVNYMSYVDYGKAKLFYFLMGISILLVIIPLSILHIKKKNQGKIEYSTRGNNIFDNSNFGTYGKDRSFEMNDKYKTSVGSFNTIYVPEGEEQDVFEKNAENQLNIKDNIVYDDDIKITDKNDGESLYGEATTKIIEDEPAYNIGMSKNDDDSYSSFSSVIRNDKQEEQTEEDEYADIAQFDTLNTASSFSDNSTVGSNRAMQGAFGDSYNPGIERKNTDQNIFGYAELPCGTYMKMQLVEINHSVELGTLERAKELLMELTKCDEQIATDIISNWDSYYNM